MTRTPAFLPTVVAIGLSLAPVRASADEAPFTSLLSQAPADTNVVVLVNASSLCGTRFYVQSQADGDPLPGLEAIDKVAAAARWRLPQCEPVTETMVVELKNSTAAAVVETVQSGKDNLLPPDTIAVELPSGLLGIYSPPDQQAARRWAQSTTRGSLSTYLMRGVGYAENVGTQLVFAIDLSDALSVTDLEAWIKSKPYNDTASIDPTKAAQTLATLEGCTLGVKFGESAVARWRFDFGGPVDAIKPVARVLMLALVNQLGLDLPGMDKWQTSIQGNSLFLSGQLDDSGLRMLLSLLSHAPRPMAMATKGNQPDAKLSDVDSPSAMKETTKAHFDSLGKLLYDIGHPQHSLITAGSKAAYLDRYAGMIDRLPILNVDPDLVDMSAEIATRLRVQAQRTRGNMIDAGTYLNNNFDQGYSVGGSGFYRSQGLTEQQMANHLARATSAKSGTEQKQQILDMVAAMRRTLTQRYQVEF